MTEGEETLLYFVNFVNITENVVLEPHSPLCGASFSPMSALCGASFSVMWGLILRYVGPHSPLRGASFSVMWGLILRYVEPHSPLRGPSVRPHSPVLLADQPSLRAAPLCIQLL